MPPYNALASGRRVVQTWDGSGSGVLSRRRLYLRVKCPGGSGSGCSSLTGEDVTNRRRGGTKLGGGTHLPVAGGGAGAEVDEAQQRLRGATDQVLGGRRHTGEHLVIRTVTL